MFGNRVRLFRLLGIPISLDLSWLIILALVTWSLEQAFRERLMPQFYSETAASIPPSYYWIMGLIGALAFFVCVVLHELGHAIVARSLGMPIRGITLFLFGGVAELGDEPVSAGVEFLMAIAGPAVSLILAIGLAVLTWVGYNGGWAPEVVLVLGYLAAINGLVLVFNLIPAFPLDGGRVLRSILWAVTGKLRQATHWASVLGQGFAWLLIAVGILELFWGSFISGIWLGLIGWFLNNAARTSYQQVLIRQALQGEPVRHFMNAQPIVVPSSLDLRQWVEDYVYRYHRKAFPVVSDGHLEGVITTQALMQVPRGEWDRHTVGELMRHDVRALTIRPDADAVYALAKMQRTGSSRLLVTDEDRLVGIISLKDLLRFLNLKLELESASPANGVGGNNGEDHHEGKLA
jgi:Zn-dependent protease/CBS domain-containing protein